MSDGSDYISIQAERIKGIKAPRRSLDVRIVLENGTVVDADVIRLQSFSGQESISNLFDLIALWLQVEGSVLIVSLPGH